MWNVTSSSLYRFSTKIVQIMPMGPKLAPSWGSWFFLLCLYEKADNFIKFKVRQIMWQKLMVLWRFCCGHFKSDSEVKNRVNTGTIHKVELLSCNIYQDQQPASCGVVSRNQQFRMKVGKERLKNKKFLSKIPCVYTSQTDKMKLARYSPKR